LIKASSLAEGILHAEDVLYAPAVSL